MTSWTGAAALPVRLKKTSSWEVEGEEVDWKAVAGRQGRIAAHLRRDEREVRRRGAARGAIVEDVQAARHGVVEVLAGCVKLLEDIRDVPTACGGRGGDGEDVKEEG